MTEHLPECLLGVVPHYMDCICPALRICEERVRSDERSNSFTPDDHADGMKEAYQRGFKDGKR